MVDRESRSKLALRLKRLALGRLSSWECENEMIELPRKDAVVEAILKTIGEMIEDDEMMDRVFLRGSEMRRRLCRWVLFLKSDLEYKWPKVKHGPGLREYYAPNWFSMIFGIHREIVRTTEMLMRLGDYEMWPFLKQCEFDEARAACGRGSVKRRS